MIVCYAGGTCGDLVCHLIDPQCGTFSGTTIDLATNRTKLKKPHQFRDVEKKDDYILESMEYPVIVSHDLSYHMLRSHNILGIRVIDQEIALWAANRFKELHRPHVWAEMQSHCGVSSIKEYAQMLKDFGNLIASYTSNVLLLEDIVTGGAISKIEELLGVTLPVESTHIYQKWLEINGSKTSTRQ